MLAYCCRASSQACATHKPETSLGMRQTVTSFTSSAWGTRLCCHYLFLSCWMCCTLFLVVVKIHTLVHINHTQMHMLAHTYTHIHTSLFMHPHTCTNRPHCGAWYFLQPPSVCQERTRARLVLGGTATKPILHHHPTYVCAPLAVFVVYCSNGKCWMCSSAEYEISKHSQ